jgi:hypothetical protein
MDGQDSLLGMDHDDPQDSRAPRDSEECTKHVRPTLCPELQGGTRLLCRGVTQPAAASVGLAGSMDVPSRASAFPNQPLETDLRERAAPASSSAQWRR